MSGGPRRAADVEDWPEEALPERNFAACLVLKRSKTMMKTRISNSRVTEGRDFLLIKFGKME
jgi:hypothetical protein